MKLSDYLFQNAISRREFATKIGITEAALCRYISGVRTPRAPIARAILNATNGAVTPNDFLAEETSDRDTEAAE